MAGNLTKTKRRIASISSTKKITKAMEMVASVKLKRFKNSFERLLAYQEEVYNQMSYIVHLLKEEYEEDKNATVSHYLQENDGGKGTLYLLITSDLGLCAGYNSNLFKFLEDRFDKEKDVLAPIGNKGLTHYLRDGGYKIDESFASIGLSVEEKSVIERCAKIKQEFNEEKYRKVVLIYTNYLNSISFVPNEETLLPLNLEYKEEDYRKNAPELLEETPHDLLHSFLPTYLYSRLYTRLVESQLSEQASRRNAMENANDNADELLRTLTIEYNKARQGAITQEIVEVVSGANAS